jgi:SWI/SNF-related matrix-associated actin-dependent regulator of chromatin subfamily A3
MCQYLRVYPYNDPKMFEADITQIWKTGSDRIAVARLKQLLRCILLRRATGILQLPEREDLRVTLRFTNEERAHYQNVERSVLNNIDAALNRSIAPQSTYLNVLQQINELRLICDQGTRRSARKAAVPSLHNWNSTVAQKAFDTLTTADSTLCFDCGIDLNGIEDRSTLRSEFVNFQSNIQMFSCLRMVCAYCVDQMTHVSCGHSPPCAKASATITPGTMRPNSASPSSSENEASTKLLPTKVKALIDDLQNLPEGTKRYVPAQQFCWDKRSTTPSNGFEHRNYQHLTTVKLNV